MSSDLATFYTRPRAAKRTGDAEALHERLVMSVRADAAVIANTRVLMPSTITGRDAQLVRPLLAIAQQAGGD